MNIKPDTYVVGWTAQSFEWYGDDEPASGKGRYKPKGDGGEIIAVNVPSLEEAHKIGRELEAAYEEGRFYDQSVYATIGRDWYVNQYHGVLVMQVEELDDIDIEILQMDSRNVKNYVYMTLIQAKML